MSNPILAYHFVGSTLRGGRAVPPDGEWLIHDGPVQMCKSGLHASRHPFDALQYALGHTLCRVEVADIVQEDTDKLVCRRRRIVTRIDATDLCRAFARACALDVVHLWNAPDVVRQYLDTGDETIRAAAMDAAMAAMDAAMAAWDAWDASWAAMAAWDAWDASWAAMAARTARAAARDASAAASAASAASAAASAASAASAAWAASAESAAWAASAESAAWAASAASAAWAASAASAASAARAARDAARDAQRARFAEMVEAAFAEVSHE